MKTTRKNLSCVTQRLSNHWSRNPPQQSADEKLRIVLVGRTRAGKTSTMNALLGTPSSTNPSASSRTTECEMRTGNVGGREVVVVDTPGVFNTELTEDKLREEIAACMVFAAPGPHVFLYVMPPDVLTEEDFVAKKIIKTIFGKKSTDHTLVLYTHGRLPQDPNHQRFRRDYDDRHFVFNNKVPQAASNQEEKLLEMIDGIVRTKSHYTNRMFQKAQERLEESRRPHSPEDEERILAEVTALLSFVMNETLTFIVKKVVESMSPIGYACAMQ